MNEKRAAMQVSDQIFSEQILPNLIFSTNATKSGHTIKTVRFPNIQAEQAKQMEAAGTLPSG